MGKFSKALYLLVMHTVPQRALDCGPGSTMSWMAMM